MRKIILYSCSFFVICDNNTPFRVAPLQLTYGYASCIIKKKKRKYFHKNATLGLQNPLYRVKGPFTKGGNGMDDKKKDLEKIECLNVDDGEILELFFERSEKALELVEKKYGKLCHTVAYRILMSDHDAEECVNDTLLKAWNSIPPQRPSRLSAYLSKIARNTALDMHDKKKASKRDAVTLALDELSECVGDEDFTDELELKDMLNRFLASLPKEQRVIFVRRYWYMCSVSEISKSLSMSVGSVKSSLSRSREKLKAYLERDGQQS